MADATTQTWPIGRLLSWTREFLAGKGVDEPRLSAELLLAHALGCRKIELYTRFEQAPSPLQVEAFRELVRQAAAHAPIAYLVGHKEFYSLDLFVSPDVLIPRPETELLVDRVVAVSRARGGAALHVLDIGTGSGCVAIAVAHLCPNALVLATDVSGAALEVAARNVERHRVADRVTLCEASGSDLPAERVPDGRFDVIVSNPPYIADGQRSTLPANVRDHEPALALFGGPDGLDVIRAIARDGLRLLAEHGRAFIEVAEGQADAAAGEFVAAGWAWLDTHRDAAGIRRVIELGRAE